MYSIDYFLIGEGRGVMSSPFRFLGGCLFNDAGEKLSSVIIVICKKLLRKLGFLRGILFICNT